MKIIEGGVCAAKGFKAGAMRCGIRKSHTKKDLAMILSDCVCNASAVYTTNRAKASPILLTKEHLADGKAQAVIGNSGNANACAGRFGGKCNRSIDRRHRSDASG